MSPIYAINGFNAKRFKNLASPTKVQLDECVEEKSLLDNQGRSEIRAPRIFISQGKEYKEGFIDHLIHLFLDKGPLRKFEKEALEYLEKLSEHHGNLVKKFGQDDPYFFGYLTLTEVRELQKRLLRVSLGEDNNEKELLQKVLNRASEKKSGIVYWMLP